MSAERSRVDIVDFEIEQAAIRAIRFAVFVDEQQVPASLEMDERDPHCVHVLAYLGGHAVGTGRVDRDGKIGRVAVLSQSRRRGVGYAVMQALHAVAKHHGMREVWCNAQVAAASFYERLGYRIVSERFEEAGIEHVRMVKDLRA